MTPLHSVHSRMIIPNALYHSFGPTQQESRSSWLWEKEVVAVTSCSLLFRPMHACLVQTTPSDQLSAVPKVLARTPSISSHRHWELTLQQPFLLQPPRRSLPQPRPLLQLQLLSPNLSVSLLGLERLPGLSLEKSPSLLHQNALMTL